MPCIWHLWPTPLGTRASSWNQMPDTEWEFFSIMQVVNAPIFFFLEASCLWILYIYVFFSVLKDHQEGPISKACQHFAVEMGDGKDSGLSTPEGFLVPCRQDIRFAPFCGVQSHSKTEIKLPYLKSHPSKCVCKDLFHTGYWIGFYCF